MSIRTTVTLEDDVAAKLRDETRKSGKSFKETINTFLRRGLNSATQVKPRRFRVQAQDMRPRLPLSYDNVAELLEQAEGPLHK